MPSRGPRKNVRFVVTNRDLESEQVYAIYRRRGDSENRIKELKDALALGRTSCHAFWANQLRVLLAAAAFVLMQELRLRLKKIGLAAAQIETLRLRLMKICGLIERSVVAWSSTWPRLIPGSHCGGKQLWLSAQQSRKGPHPLRETRRRRLADGSVCLVERTKRELMS